MAKKKNDHVLADLTKHDWFSIHMQLQSTIEALMSAQNHAFNIATGNKAVLDRVVMDVNRAEKLLGQIFSDEARP